LYAAARARLRQSARPCGTLADAVLMGIRDSRLPPYRARLCCWTSSCQTGMDSMRRLRTSS